MLFNLVPHGAMLSMWAATRLSVEVLEWAAGDPAPDLAHLPRDLGHAAVVTRSTNAMEGLKAVLALPPAERLLLAKAVRSDAEFHEHLDDDDFAFAFPARPPGTRNAAKAFLGSFYDDLLKSGFRDLPHQDLPLLNKAAVERAFFRANMHLCGGCLSSLRVRHRTSPNDRDHFFPKAHYPALALHPFNLTLICPLCNSRVKGERDPLLPDLQGPALRGQDALDRRGTVGMLRSTYVPYHRSAREEIVVRIDRQARSARGPFSLRVEGRPGGHSAARIRSLDWLFEISVVWGDRLVEVHMEALHQCRRCILDQDAVRRRLLKLVEDERDRGRSHQDQYLLGRYAAYITEDGTRLRAFVAELAQPDTKHALRREAPTPARNTPKLTLPPL